MSEGEPLLYRAAGVCKGRAGSFSLRYLVSGFPCQTQSLQVVYMIVFALTLDEYIVKMFQQLRPYARQKYTLALILTSGCCYYYYNIGTMLLCPLGTRVRRQHVYSRSKLIHVLYQEYERCCDTVRPKFIYLLRGVERGDKWRGK